MPIDTRMAAALIAPTAFTITMNGGTWAAGLRQLVPLSMPGRATAICDMLMTLAGIGLGPTLGGAQSHWLTPLGRSLALPLLIVCAGAQLLGGWALWMASKPYRSVIRMALR